MKDINYGQIISRKNRRELITMIDIRNDSYEVFNHLLINHQHTMSVLVRVECKSIATPPLKLLIIVFSNINIQ